MNIKEVVSAACCCRLFAGVFSLMALDACSVLQPAATPSPAFYSLDGTPGRATVAAPISAPTLIISPPHAVAGYDLSLIHISEPTRPY